MKIRELVSFLRSQFILPTRTTKLTERIERMAYTAAKTVEPIVHTGERLGHKLDNLLDYFRALRAKPFSLFQPRGTFIRENPENVFNPDSTKPQE